MAIRYTPRQMRALVRETPEASDGDLIAALESERIILAPYATTKDLPKLKARLREIDHRLALMRGLPLEAAVCPDGESGPC